MVATIFVRRMNAIIGPASVEPVDRIRISRLKEMGIHGVLPEEQVRPQPFEVDIELVVDTQASGDSDDLDDTVDYGAVCEAVSRVVSAESYQLLERLAARIVEVCQHDERVKGVIVEVRKMKPPVRALVDHVAVRIER
jgi:dihydroneopterin aldolase